MQLVWCVLSFILTPSPPPSPQMLSLWLNRELPKFNAERQLGNSNQRGWFVFAGLESLGIVASILCVHNSNIASSQRPQKYRFLLESLYTSTITILNIICVFKEQRCTLTFFKCLLPNLSSWASPTDFFYFF